MDHFGINRRPQDVHTMSSQRPGDIFKTNFWTSRNGHFAAWVTISDVLRTSVFCLGTDHHLARSNVLRTSVCHLGSLVTFHQQYIFLSDKYLTLLSFHFLEELLEF